MRPRKARLVRVLVGLMCVWEREVLLCNSGMRKRLGPHEHPLDSGSFLCLHSGLLLFSPAECLGNLFSSCCACVLTVEHFKANILSFSQLSSHWLHQCCDVGLRFNWAVVWVVLNIMGLYSLFLSLCCYCCCFVFMVR